MTLPKPFRFGVKFRRTENMTTLTERARRLESLGYSTLLFSDHFWNVLAPLPTAAAVAAVTTTLRVGTNVLGNDFRHPAALAKEAATIDLLSGGRFEFGYGAGWMADDYRRIGIPMDSPGTRIERMEEAIEVMKGLWSEGVFEYRGKHYAIEDLDGFPLPHRPGGPSLLIGGGGRKILSVAVKHADIIGINPRAGSGTHDAATNHDASEAAVDRKIGWVREMAGDRLSEIELSMNAYIAHVTEEPGAPERLLSERFQLPPEEALRVPHGWVGSIDKIAENLQEWRERWGISYWIVQDESADELAPLVARLAGT